MTAITYDFIKRLEQAGFTPAQVEVLATFTTEAASKPEIIQVEKDLINKIEKSESVLEKRIDKVEADIKELKADVKEQFESLRSLIKWLIGIAIALIPSLNMWFSYISHLAAK